MGICGLYRSAGAVFARSDGSEECRWSEPAGCGTFRDYHRPRHGRDACSVGTRGMTDRIATAFRATTLPNPKGLPPMPRREQLEQLLQSEPDDVFLNYGLAKALASEGDIDAALRQFDRVLVLDPDYVAAWFQKGQTLADSGQTEAAREALRRGIDVARRVGDRHAEGEMIGFLESL